MNRIEYPAQLHLRDDGDGRTVEGVVLPWNIEARVLDRGRLVVETFERGALADADPARVPLTATHPRDNQQLPIGVTVELVERDDAAWGRGGSPIPRSGTKSWPWPATASRLGLSIGFAEVPGGSRWSAEGQRVTRIRAALDHVAVVRVPAYQGAGVVGVRRRVAPATPVLLTLLGRRG